MTAEPQSTPDTTGPAADRAELLAALHAAPSPFAAKRWMVVRQYNHLADHQVCAHRWEWIAELCARRRMTRHADEVGVFYTARSYTDRWQKRLAGPERRELES